MQPTTREVVSRSPSHTVRQLNLPQLQEAESIDADSDPERRFAHIAALYPFTEHIRHQPFKLVWDDASYTPDFLLTFRDKSKLVVEVKPSDKVEKYQMLFQRATQKLQASGYLFYVATDTQISASDRSANALLIRRYAKASFPKSACEALLERVTKTPAGVSVKQLCGADVYSHCVLRHLISKRLLATAPDLSTEPSSIISIPISSGVQSHALQFSTWFDS